MAFIILALEGQSFIEFLLLDLSDEVNISFVHSASLFVIDVIKQEIYAKHPALIFDQFSHVFAQAPCTISVY